MAPLVFKAMLDNNNSSLKGAVKKFDTFPEIVIYYNGTLTYHNHLL